MSHNLTLLSMFGGWKHFEEYIVLLFTLLRGVGTSNSCWTKASKMELSTTSSRILSGLISTPLTIRRRAPKCNLRDGSYLCELARILYAYSPVPIPSASQWTWLWLGRSNHPGNSSAARPRYSTLVPEPDSGDRRLVEEWRKTPEHPSKKDVRRGVGLLCGCTCTIWTRDRLFHCGCISSK